MHNIMRYIRQNRKKIIRIALIVLSLIGLLELLNYFAKSNTKQDNVKENSDIYNLTNGTIISEKSAVSGGSVSQDELNDVSNLIKQFIENCNKGNIEDAYNMLSDNCKNQLYPNIEKFKVNYYEGLFENNTRTYSIENWFKNTYVVKYTGDILATGKSSDDFTYQDYITIEEQNGENKLNISKYIGKESLNKKKKTNNIEMTALYREKYMDYEIYTIEITNNTNGEILLDSLKNTDTIYLKDNNNVKHVAYSNEIIKENLRVYKNETKVIEIKFDNPYILERKIEELCFSRVFLDFRSNNFAEAETIRFNLKF